MDAIESDSVFVRASAAITVVGRIPDRSVHSGVDTDKLTTLVHNGATTASSEPVCVSIQRDLFDSMSATELCVKQNGAECCERILTN